MPRACQRRTIALLVLCATTGCVQHHYYTSTPVGVCPPGTEPAIDLGSAEDVSGGRIVAVRPGRTTVIAGNTPRSSGVVISEPTLGYPSQGAWRGLGRSDQSSIATSRVEGAIRDDSSIR